MAFQFQGRCWELPRGVLTSAVRGNQQRTGSRSPWNPKHLQHEGTAGACLSHTGHSKDRSCRYEGDPAAQCPRPWASATPLPIPPSPSKHSFSLTGVPTSPVALDLLGRSDLYWFIAKIFIPCMSVMLLDRWRQEA